MNEALTIYGPLGVMVIGLAYAVIHLYREVKALHAKREADVQVLTGLVTSSAASNDRTADVLEEFGNRLPTWIRNGKR